MDKFLDFPENMYADEKRDILAAMEEYASLKLKESGVVEKNDIDKLLEALDELRSDEMWNDLPWGKRVDFQKAINEYNQKYKP